MFFNGGFPRTPNAFFFDLASCLRAKPSPAGNFFQVGTLAKCSVSLRTSSDLGARWRACAGSHSCHVGRLKLLTPFFGLPSALIFPSRCLSPQRRSSSPDVLDLGQILPSPPSPSFPRVIVLPFSDRSLEMNSH